LTSISSAPPERGRFVTFEGIDGAGKSSHVEAFAARLRARGLAVEVTREPGGTAIAEAIRGLLLEHPMSPTTELLLAFAARADHLDRVIRPALAAGRWVVCDRFTDSTFAYQGGGRELGSGVVATLEAIVHPDLQPDLTILFELDPDEAARRRARARAADRIEREDLAFFERVAQAYRDRAQACPQRFHRVDGRQALELIAHQLQELADQWLR
jgi:dTMP kinase